MKKFFSVVIFLLAFQIEVRVRASADVLQQPTACLKSAETCAIHVSSSAFHLKQGDLKLHSSKGSTLMRLSQAQWRLVKGTLWVEEASDVQVETPYATAQSSHGQYWLIEKDGRIIVRNVDANLNVQLRDGRKLEIPAGFEFWISGINSHGKSEYGMIQPIDIKNHLVLWNSLYTGSAEEFKNEVAHLKENWGDLADRGATLYQRITERRIASVEEERRQQDEKKRQMQAERQKVRELMYQRAFER